jgi:glutathione S-transferase
VTPASPYILYGSHASYATAKSRSYLRKKGIPFIERLPAAPRFREHVRPSSGSHRIPQLETPDGAVIQDTTAIFDYLEARFPEPPGYPPGPRQVLQRAIDWFSGLGESDQSACRALLASCDAGALIDVRLARRLARVGSCMALE